MSNKPWSSLFDTTVSTTENKKSDFMTIRDIVNNSHGFNFIEKIPQSIIKKSKMNKKN